MKPPAADVCQPLPVYLWHELRIGLPLCLGIAVFISVVFRDSFWLNLVYSLCIGLSIQALIEGGRYSAAAWLRRRHPLRCSAESNWPGWAFMAPWVLLSTVVGYWIGSALGDAFSGARYGSAVFDGNWRVLAIVLVCSLSVSVAATYFFYSRSLMATLHVQAEAARRSAAEQQLKLLASQLEPHMLFNTLSNLRVLIALDSGRAQAMLDHLIAFLRATLQASRTGSHALADEFDRVNDYLALMQIRMGPRLTVALNLPNELRALAVPPLLLQPLVENAIVHGLEPKVEGGHIEISAQRDGQRLRLSVRDSGVGVMGGIAKAGSGIDIGVGVGASVGVGTDTSNDQPGRGFGTAQVRDRLAAQFGPAASFTLRASADGGTLAVIELPLPP